MKKQTWLTRNISNIDRRIYTRWCAYLLLLSLLLYRLYIIMQIALDLNCKFLAFLLLLLRCIGDGVSQRHVQTYMAYNSLKDFGCYLFHR